MRGHSNFLLVDANYLASRWGTKPTGSTYLSFSELSRLMQTSKMLLIAPIYDTRYMPHYWSITWIFQNDDFKDRREKWGDYSRTAAFPSGSLVTAANQLRTALDIFITSINCAGLICYRNSTFSFLDLLNSRNACLGELLEGAAECSDCKRIARRNATHAAFDVRFFPRAGPAREIPRCIARSRSLAVHARENRF